MLSTHHCDIEATQIAANVMQALWKPITVSNGIPTTEQWFERLKESIKLPHTFNKSLIDKASQIASR